MPMMLGANVGREDGQQWRVGPGGSEASDPANLRREAA
jgi:hypothetical protein